MMQFQYAEKHSDEALILEVIEFQQRDAWANMLPILGTAFFFREEIRICVRQHIIRCSPWPHALPATKGLKGVISSYFE